MTPDERREAMESRHQEDVDIVGGGRAGAEARRRRIREGRNLVTGRWPE